MPVCQLQYLSNLHGDHLRLYLRNTQEFHVQTCSQSPRHNEILHGFGCWRSVRWRALILSNERPHFGARLACSAPMPRCLGGPPLPGRQGIEKDRLSSDCLLRHPIGLRLERLRRRTMTCCVLQQYSGIADLYLVRALAEIATNMEEHHRPAVRWSA